MRSNWRIDQQSRNFLRAKHPRARVSRGFKRSGLPLVGNILA
jgi:hypothetical protein